MRCPRCGYTSFDYLEACSKCRADLYEEKIRLNLPNGPFKPISLTDMLALTVSPVTEITPPPEDTTLKLVKLEVGGPKTFDLDLSNDGEMETLAEKLLAKSGAIPLRKGGELSLDLSLD